MDIFLFNKSICFQLEGITFIHLQRTNDTHPTSRKIYWFKNVIMIQKNYIHSTNFCSRKQIHIIRSRKLHSFNKTNKKYIFSQDLKFPVFSTNQVRGNRRQKHAFNELGSPYPSWFEIPTHHSIFSTIPSSRTLLHSVQREARRSAIYLSTLVKPKALRCNKVFSFISHIVLPANSFSWVL